MDSWFDGLLDWIAAHPVAAGAVVFLIALCDSLIVLGAIVPALPLLIGVGVVIGLGELSGPYAVVCAALGAFVGDGVSFWVGRRWGTQLRAHWPFSKYPQLLERGERLFHRNSLKAIFIARYVGPIRPFVPAVAGMLHMPLKRYLPASAAAGLSWAVLFLLPGWMLGQAYDAVAAVAGRLAVVVGLLLVVLGVIWAAVLYSYRWFAAHADALLARGLAWSRAHPVLGRHSVALFDPRRRETVSLAVLAVALLALAWVLFAFLAVVLGHGEPLGVDLALYELMHSLRNPLADRPLAAIAAIGDADVLAPAWLAVLGYLAWRKRWLAVGHWVAAIVFGVALTGWLGVVVDIPKPPVVAGGFGFPSKAVTMSTIIFGFFAVLISRELPGRDRAWPYVVAGVVVSTIGFARIYLGAHWLSDVVGGTLLGVVWVLILGVAYRSRVRRSLWVKPLAWLFYGVFVLAALWHGPRAVDRMLALFDAPIASIARPLPDWWKDDWRKLPATRNEFDDAQRWPLDVQIAGPLQPLVRHLEDQGWRLQPQAGWERALQLLDSDLPRERHPVLPATLDTRAESLLMLKPGPRADQQYALRLWASPIALQPGQVPLWIGGAQTLRHQTLFGLVGMWRPLPDADASLDQVRDSVRGLPQALAPHPSSGLPVLRLRTDQLPLEHAPPAQLPPVRAR
ncbi:bifunctional DedA family/phosphatase PAP2 family protein [Pseudoxanthomonas winnipegensis]|uniref:Phosphatase PAP2 family protein n=1 Tax=Pseudoxanthomonas winnipegensis TaxID=2480810 RepID=A0A4Q8LL84_9GAMM|nr:bifunctional DedA family/phosphatase PAP2 family protein [Pseudoxanthomonas winnipegensis]RZZ86141.1 phosphatase PAP2 family protein [Pseudoxanthomonas winnipegensis]TAA31278.1 phosphatase PAP2 family protein [Pseudoxanthomonas winnipegensis]TBV77418.1 phosphatase PAP2 family protein [Pseudoxanthomonas winnipegensis]